MSRAVFVDCPSFLAALYSTELEAIVPDLAVNVGDPSEDEVVALLEGRVAALNDHCYMPARLLEACPGLKIIVFMGTGASSYVDVAAAERLGIRVRTFRGYGDRSIAEHALALMFAAGRQIAAMDRGVRAGDWRVLDGIEFAGKTLGVVGTGGVGREMARLGHALGMEVIAWNRSGVSDDLPCAPCALDDLLARADVVSLHLALGEQTRGIIDARCIGLMKPSAILVNTARGALVDEAALVEALRAGRIRHAALDVFDDEPLAADHPMAGLDNVTLSAHAAFMTAEASKRMWRMALEILRDELAALAER
ncbi:MAG: 2-hydroxyacid dehydrogenase [Alphaproteobacteria bacterium]